MSKGKSTYLTLEEYRAQVEKQIEPLWYKDANDLRLNIMAATSHIPGVFAPAVHALHSSRFNIQLPVSTPLTDLPDGYMELDHELVLCLEVEASKGTTEPMLLHPQPSENDVSNEVVRQQIMDGLTLSSEDSEVVEVASRGQNTNIEWWFKQRMGAITSRASGGRGDKGTGNIEWFKQRMGAITSTQTENIRKFSAPDSRISAERLVTTCLSKQCQHMKNVPRPNQHALKYGGMYPGPTNLS